MIHCIVIRCDWKGRNIEQLYAHLNRFHESLETFRCNYQTCTRSFGIRSTFFRHLKEHLKHEHNHPQPIDVDVGAAAPERKNCPPEHNLCVDLNHPHHQPASTSNTKLDSNPNVNVGNSFTNTLEQKFNNVSLDNNNLTLKWLNLNSMPRSTVFEIQKDIQVAILNPLNNILTSLEQAGCVSEEVKQLLSNALKIFDESQTEYTYQKKLHSEGLFETPQEFTVAKGQPPLDDENQSANTIKGLFVT